jgi:hypothetical protein
MAAEDVLGLRHGGGIEVGQAAFDKLGDAAADERGDDIDRKFRTPQLTHHAVGGGGEVGNGVEQGAIEVDGDGADRGHRRNHSMARGR